MLKFNNLLTQ